LDYLAVKVPRWDLVKLKSSDRHIGSEMKSVGEVMALGRSFPEALQKALRMLNIGAGGLSEHIFKFTNPEDEITRPTDRRIFAIYEAMRAGASVDKIHDWSKIDKWFLNHIADIEETERRIAEGNLTYDLMKEAKQKGFSDKVIASLKKTNEKSIRAKRQKLGVVPCIKQIDTLAGEFDAETNYLYTT
jgi:carbamoyl-phosphate synthase large subunit